jgi:hypothetical protein
MVRQDYFQRKAHELLEIAQAIRAPQAYFDGSRRATPT